MRYLLDTHVVVWAVTDDPRLGPHTRAVLTAADDVLVSAATWWELTIKHRLGKFALLAQVSEAASSNGLRDHAVERRHALAITDVELPRRDPFDRLLVAQARVDGLYFVTADLAILSAGLPGIHDARS